MLFDCPIRSDSSSATMDSVLMRDMDDRSADLQNSACWGRFWFMPSVLGLTAGKGAVFVGVQRQIALFSPMCSIYGRDLDVQIWTGSLQSDR